jgi:hypothetical protein
MGAGPSVIYAAHALEAYKQFAQSKAAQCATTPANARGEVAQARTPRTS